jgi:DNA-binding LacI/PurR family transcriptional regulator
MEAPIVLLNNQHPSEMAHSVSIDNADGGYQATAHLLALGHKDIAYIGDESGLQSDEERLGGFQAAMKHAQVTIRQDWWFVATASSPWAERARRNCWLLAQRQPPSSAITT